MTNRIGLLIFCCLFISRHGFSQTKKKQPNILLIVADHWRNDWIGCIDDSDLKTPNVDKLANEGVLFTQAICNSPQCAPSRASMAAGCYAGRLGVYQNNTGVFPSKVLGFKKAQRSIYSALRENGYRVGTVGKLDLTKGAELNKDESAKFYYDIGFDDPFEWVAYDNKYLKKLYPETGLFEKYEKYGHLRTGKYPLDEKYFFDNVVGDKAFSMMKGYNRNDKPWFLQINFHAPHPPWNAPESYLKRYKGATLPAHINHMAENKPPNVITKAAKKKSEEITDEGILEIKQHYAAKMAVIDDWIGKYLSWMKVQGIDENTIIIFTSDHGEMMFDHGLTSKEQMYEGSVRVPLIITGKNVAKGQKSHALAELVDLYPTIMDFAGVSIKGEDIDGISLSKTLQNPDLKHKEYQYSEFLAKNEWPYAAIRMVYNGNFKLIENYGFKELYNLEEDPKELNNCAKQYPDVVDKLLNYMNEYSKKSIPPQYLPK